MMKKLLTFFLTALLAFSVGWAAQLTYTFTSQSAGTLQGAPTGVTASFTQNANGYTQGQGVQLTSKKNTLTLTIKNFTSSYKLTGITLNYCTNASKGAGTVTAKLGNTDVATPYSINSTGGTDLRDAVMTVTETAFNGSDLVLTVIATANSVYVNSFTVSYEENGSTPPTAEDVTLSFPEASYTATLGQGFTAPTLSVTPAAAASQVSYTSSNTGVATVNATTGAVTLVGAGTTTITASVPASSTYNAATASYNLTVTSGGGSGGSGDFMLVTDASTLNAGDEIIFVNATSGSAYAMGDQNTNNRPGVSVTVNSGPSVSDADDIEIFTLEGGTGAWYFKANKLTPGYLYAASSGNNYLRTETTADNNAKATISIDSNVASITFQGDNTRNQLKYNSQNHIFSCYASGQQPVYIYRRTTTPKVKTPTFSPDPSVTYTSAQTVTISSATEGATIVYSVNNGEMQSALSPVTITVSSTSDIEAYATLTGYDDSDVATATYTINLSPSLTATPNPLNINDDNTSGGRTGSFTVTGANLGTANVGLTRTNNEFTPALSATTGTTYAGEYNGTPYWGFAPAGSLEGTVAMTYNGHALSATTAVNLSNGNNASLAVDVNYLYTGPIYLYGNVGVDADHINNFDFSNGVAMTRNTTDGTYSVNITAVGQNGGSYSWMYFSKNQGQESDAEATKFGPISDESYWPLQGADDYTGVACALDPNLVGSSARTIRLNPGEYTVEINPNNNTFTISALVHAPVISLASGTYSGTQEVTITCATPGAAIYYTTDGSEPSANNGTLYDGNAISISESVTLKAVAVSNGVTSSVASAEYLITPPFVAKDYEMLTDINDLVAGKTYLIVYKSNDDAETAIVMGPVNASNYGVAVEGIPETNGLITSTEAMAVVTLAGQSGNWTLLTSQGILASPSSNALNYGDTPHTWTIGHKDGNNNDLGNKFAIRSNTNTDRYLQFNNNNNQHRFACYKGTQQYVYIYKESSTPAIVANPTTVSIELAAGEAQGSNTFTVGGRNLTEGVTLTLSAEDQAKGFSLSTNSISKEAALAGNVEVTVTYNGQDATETASITLSSAGATDVTVTVNATREPLTVTISPASCNFVGSVMSEPVTITANVAGATIEYSLDNGTTWQTYTDGITITIGQVNNSVTVMARATLTAGGNTYTSTTVSETYTRQPKGETLYEKVTSEDQIKAGEKYIIVYEGSTPVAFNGIYSDGNVSNVGSGVNTVWRTANKVVDIANTDATVFTLGGTADNWTLHATEGYLESIDASGSGIKFYSSTTSGYQWETVGNETNGYYLTWDSYTLRYNPQIADRGPFRLYSNSTGSPAYLYVLRPAVEEPVISPATGTYYENEQVTISSEAGTTVYYTTDGSDPTISSTPYQGPFTVNYVDGGTTTIKAVAVDDEGNVSTIATATYTWGKPSVAIIPDSRNVTADNVNVTLTSTPAGATIYYTTDGSTPTTASEQYNGAFSVSLPNVGDVANVKAIAVYNGLTSEVATATYTRVDKVIDVKAPFFSPLAGTNGGYSGIYYGEQTLQIGCTTPNADIYYKIEEVTGETVPATVADPTKQSSYYDAAQTITMEVGKSYRVKAIAYVAGFASTITEGYYIIKSFSDFQNEHSGDGYTYVANCAEFNALTSTGTKISFTNPVQVVYHSTYANNGTMAEFCYVRDNTDYACIYFGKRDTHNYHIFKMGDWIDGYNISGEMNIWENNYHNQLGTSGHTIEYWPSEALGWSEIIPTPTTCNAISSGTTAPGHNLWGNYVHLRNTTLSDVADYASDDPKHKGTITDASGSDTYYDKFYLWSAGTCSYNGNHDVIQHLGDYDQAFFTAKQNAGATFDVYGIVDYYKPYDRPFEVCPIDFLWTYKPVITVTPGETVTGQVDTYAVPQTVTISATQPEWAAENVVIYYKTDDMDDWAEYTGPFVVSSNTSVQTYAEVYAKKNDAAETDYNDYVRSVTVSQDFKFQGIEDPEIAPGSQVIEIVNGNETVEVVIAANNDNNSNVITVYTTDGTMPSATNGTEIAAGERVELDPITETTTVTAISYLPDANGNPVLWSNVVTETYTFVKKNGVIYDLLTTAPTVGNVYVIVNKDAYMGLSTKQNENNRGSVGVMFTDDTKTKVYGNDELALFVLEKADGNRYYFKNINGNGYLTVAGNTGLQTGDADYYASASVEIGDQSAGYPATITFRGDNLRTMRYFDNGRTFSTYTDASLNKDVFMYGVNATPLAYIESTPSLEGKQVTVSDQLIGAWAVDYVNADNEHINLLWAKDQGYSIDKTEINTEIGQKDYVKSILKYENKDAWDQSNWVIIDFKNLGDESAEDYVGHKLEMASVTGIYTNKDNYTIKLNGAAPVKVDNSNEGDAPEFSGYGRTDPQASDPQAYNGPGYNTYLPANFLDENLNYPYSEKYEDEGFVAGSDALGSHEGEKLFFMNPKVEEVARIWAVWAGTVDGKDMFTVYVPNLENGINGWAFKGAFNVDWCYNRLGSNGAYGRPEYLNDGKKNHAFLFHAAIQLKSQGRSLRATNYTPSDADMNSPLSDRFMVYPLDFPSNADNFTAVVDVKGAKVVESVRYYNIMGMESEQPFEGINIVVTRYSDGSSSTAKVLR